eukprot:2807301-Karenia_brevis.AAC.1
MVEAGTFSEDPPLPHYISQPPPMEINAYSDGSFTHPTQPVYGTITAGVWWPGRNGDCLSHIESDYGETSLKPDGLE